MNELTTSPSNQQQQQSEGENKEITYDKTSSSLGLKRYRRTSLVSVQALPILENKISGDSTTNSSNIAINRPFVHPEEADRKMFNENALVFLSFRSFVLLFSPLRSLPLILFLHCIVFSFFFLFTFSLLE